MASHVQATSGTGGAIRVDVVSSTPGLNALQDDWERLVDLMEVPSPFLSWYWNRTWWEHFGGRHKMKVAVLREDGVVVGIAPFYLLGFGPIGACVPFGWPDRLTEQMEPIIPGPNKERLQAALNTWLVHENAAGLATGFDPSAAQCLGERSLREQVYFDWRPLPSTWDELLNGLGRSMRGNIRYYPRLLQRSGHSFSFRVATDVVGVRAALPILFALHSARANAPGLETHRDRLAQLERRSFLHRMASVLAPRGEMKVGILQVDGSDVAAQLWFERSGTIFMHYSGFIPEWSRFSVAMIATSEIIRLAVERHMKRVEFLRGSKQFKTRWNTQQRVQTDVYYVRQRWLLPLFHKIRSLKRRMQARTYRSPIPQSLAEPAAD
jgi:CelD/BcsL family acetyltransferase involved in cellulose biosynthesis